MAKFVISIHGVCCAVPDKANESWKVYFPVDATHNVKFTPIRLNGSDSPVPGHTYVLGQQGTTVGRSLAIAAKNQTPNYNENRTGAWLQLFNMTKDDRNSSGPLYHQGLTLRTHEWDRNGIVLTIPGGELESSNDKTIPLNVFSIDTNTGAWTIVEKDAVFSESLKITLEADELELKTGLKFDLNPLPFDLKYTDDHLLHINNDCGMYHCSTGVDYDLKMLYSLVKDSTDSNRQIGLKEGTVRIGQVEKALPSPFRIPCHVTVADGIG
ncbi:MAG: hypothetical protein R2684_09020 [Pyrinomonadaceae bacterium]